MPDAVNGDSFSWHQLYSLPYTKVLGFVACCTTPKQLGICAKQIKDRKRSNLGCTSLETRAILYSSARQNEAQIRAFFLR